MAYEFTKLGEVEALEKMPEGANALVEVEGDIKRVPGDGLSGGIKTAIIKSSDYDDALAGISTADVVVTFSCINMTFEEAWAELMAGKPLNATVLNVFDDENGRVLECSQCFISLDSAQPNAIILFGSSTLFFWTSDSISTEAPSGASTLSAKLSRAKTTSEA